MAAIEGSIKRAGIRLAVIAGGAAGDHTVTGIKTRDILIGVLVHKNSAALEDLTDEFEITDDDEINNTGGTATSANNQLIVFYHCVH